MPARDWFTLALRVLGIWLLIQTVQHVVPLAYLLSEYGPFRTGFLGMGGAFGAFDWSYIIFYAAQVTVHTGFGLGLLMYGPLIARRFYPADESTAAAPGASADDLYRIGCRLLGIYSFLLAVPPVARMAGGGVDPDEVVRGGLYLAMAALLLLGAKRIGAILSRIRYDPQRDAYQPPPAEKEPEEKTRRAATSDAGDQP